MNEQELRAAVAEYDPVLAESAWMDNEWLTFTRSTPYVFVETDGVHVFRKSVSIGRMECRVRGNIAATLRAMDAAETAFSGAL